MAERITNTLFKIHVGRFIWYVNLWIWCWEHDAPIFITWLPVMLIKINTKTAHIYSGATYKKREEKD